MSKARENQLDSYAAQLEGWFGVEKLTYAEALEKLQALGCSTSKSALQRWWDRRYSEIRQERVLAQISMHGEEVKKVEAAFRKNAGPTMEAIKRLHETIAWQLNMKAATDPEMLEAANQFTRTVIEFAKEQGKTEERNLTREKFERETCALFLKWFKDQKAREIADSNASNSEKIAALRQTYFADVDALQKSGQVKLPS